MKHDFFKKYEHEGDEDYIKVPRLDSHDQSCSGKGGIMDYDKTNENDKSRWTSCSIEDFTQLMNTNKTCLQVIDPKNPPKMPSPIDLTVNECDLSSLYPGLNGIHILYLNGNNLKNVILSEVP